MHNNHIKHTGAEGSREWALYLARQLDEPHLVDYYERLVGSHSIEGIKKALAEAQAFPKARIVKSRAALFKYFLNQYAKSDTK